SPPLFPLENRTCELLGKRIRTVDGQEIDYEICDHVMVLDAQNSNFNITVKKTCSQNPTTCQKIYLVQHDETLVSVDSDTEVMINGNYYTASQLVVYNKRNP
ncbi:VWD domain-containing protein, partial [Staphylococcus aureus]|uniref:VWD domain-containing protein n=1 Tax=Staphylococcus aureus TaxID=1280 RepID=UPI0038B39C28